MNRLYILIAATLLSACTTQMFVAKTSFDDGDKKCMAQAYWYKTSYLIGSKTDRVLTVTAGGQRRPVQYKEQDGMVAYKGEASRDIKVYGEAPQGREFLCGWVDQIAELGKFEGDRLKLYMHCKAKLDELSLAKGYLPAQELPYQFAVSKESLFSFTGKHPEAPRPPTCSPR
jgi:hypothetical protein